MTRGESVAARARALVGARFRPQGRDPAVGLDCVGTAAAAAGVPAGRIRRDYPMRGHSLAEMEAELQGLGCAAVEIEAMAAGDVVLCEAGPLQLHIAVLTGEGFVHADAGLRMVVERPLPLPWPIRRVWRLSEEQG